MEISKSLKKEIDKLLNVKQININIADMLLTSYEYEDIVTEKKLKEKKSLGLSEKESYFSLLLDFFQIDVEDEESIDIANKYIFNNLKECDEKEYLDNPYVKLVKAKELKNKNYKLTNIHYLPYQGFALDEIDVTDYPYEEYYKVGYFKNKFSYLSLIKDDNIWMSVNPNEINTMKPFIKDAKGNVLVLGLGMGYIAYMMSLKEEVKSITVVELDENIISIFKENILPVLGPTKAKIKIVHDDAIRYLENNHKFDYYFADLWHNPEDGLPIYLNLEYISQKFKIPMNYWLNASLKAMKRRCLLTLIEEYFMGYSDKDYRFVKNPMDQAINYLYRINKNMKINTLEELKKFLA